MRRSRDPWWVGVTLVVAFTAIVFFGVSWAIDHTLRPHPCPVVLFPDRTWAPQGWLPSATGWPPACTVTVKVAP